jgi:phosphatidylglycerol:prolipoprotein diacylglycerol transferase
MSFPHGLVPTVERVHPTPVYEFMAAMAIAAVLWWFAGKRSGRRVGEVTGLYLVLSGIARFLVEFIRINPPIYHGLTNAQVASVGTVVVGLALFVWAKSRSTVGSTPGGISLGASTS